MVIAWDRRSGVSRNIPRWFHPTPGSDPTRTERPSRRDGYAILDGGAALRQAGPSRPGCQIQPKCDPLAAKYQRLAGGSRFRDAGHLYTWKRMR